MKKSVKQKTSIHTAKSSRNLTIREAVSLSNRTPISKKKKVDTVKSPNLHKFKSIPNLSYRDIEVSIIPTENMIYQSYVNTHFENTVNETEPRLMYSVSDRNNFSESKLSMHYKGERTAKSKKTTCTSKNKSNCTLETNRKKEKETFKNIYERTKVVLDIYKEKEIQWKKEKQSLYTELEKLKNLNKNKKKNYSSFIITNQSKLTKL